MDIIKVRAAFDAYKRAVNGNQPEARRKVLAEMLGIGNERDPFTVALKLMPGNVLWRCKSDQPRDLDTVVQTERMATEDVIRRYGFTGKPDEESERCLTALTRLFLVESLVEITRPFVNITRKEYQHKMQASMYMKAREVYVLMLPEQFNIQEISAPGVSVTRSALGTQIEEARKHLTSGGF